MEFFALVLLADSRSVAYSDDRQTYMSHAMSRMEEVDGLPQLTVNFDPAMVCMLREVRYFLLLRETPVEIPATTFKVRSGMQKQPLLSLVFHLKAQSCVCT